MDKIDFFFSFLCRIIKVYYSIKNKMNQLPMDVVNIILEYQGYHVDRNKKYIWRLDMNS